MEKQNKLKIAGHIISGNSPDFFVIAEIGHNHQGDIGIAKRLIDEAERNGAHAVKFQKRDNKTLFTKEMYYKPYENENSFGLTYGEHREALEFGESEYRELKFYAEGKNLVFFSTAFDRNSVDFLEEIGVPAFKVASGDITNIPLLEYIAGKKKPIFMSTGHCGIEDVRRAYDILKKHTDEICIMQCTAEYPADPGNIHLNVISSFLREFPEAIIGYSGHDNGIILPVIAYVLGARVIEKHFTLSRAMKGNDHKFSLEPQGMRKMTRDLMRTYAAFGSSEKKAYPFEIPAIHKMGKSIVLKKGLRKGEIISGDSVDYKTPGFGIPPSKADMVLGRKAARDLPEETILSFEDVK